MLSIKRQEISLNGQKNVIDVCLLSQFFDTNLARKKQRERNTVRSTWINVYKGRTYVAGKRPILPRTSPK
jgi:hypothetical protein